MTGIEAPDGLHNFRDPGGMPLADGGTIRPGVLVRSDALATLTERGRAAFADSGVRVVVDLRSETERNLAPDPTWELIPHVDLPMLDGALAQLAERALHAPTRGAAMLAAAQALAHLPSLDELYISLLRSGGAQFVYLAQLVDHAGAGVLLHCTAGKDRTGITTAVLLDAVGAEREAVIEDYAATEANLAPVWAPAMRERVAAMGVRSSRALDALLTRSPPSAMRRALDWLDEHHGGAASYLLAHGLTAAQLAALRSRLRA